MKLIYLPLFLSLFFAFIKNAVSQASKCPDLAQDYNCELYEDTFDGDLNKSGPLYGELHFSKSSSSKNITTSILFYKDGLECDYPTFIANYYTLPGKMRSSNGDTERTTLTCPSTSSLLITTSHYIPSTGKREKIEKVEIDMIASDFIVLRHTLKNYTDTYLCTEQVSKTENR